MSTLIFHITKQELWEQAKLDGRYYGDKLESFGGEPYDGFIHCSTLDQIVNVANRFFKGKSGLFFLCIEREKVISEVRYEGADDDEIYPHIYGQLNIDAVVKVLDLKPDKNGKFKLPAELT